MNSPCLGGQLLRSLTSTLAYWTPAYPFAIILAPMNRRRFLQATAASAASLALSRNSFAADNPDLAAIQKEIEKRHDESVQRLQQWIRQPSIAAEHRGMDEGCDLAMRMLRDAGFGQVTKIPTDGQPGIFATLDAGAPRTARYLLHV